jgi:NAD(P)-dependent dehydrogenase (short-subunit alcohol dehydrogenase family)
MTPQTKVALITGVSNGGTGMAAALDLAQAGWTVYATSRRPDSIAHLQERGLRVLKLDVTDENSMQAAVRVVESEHGAVGALINNAAYGEMGAVEQVPLDRIRRQFETNVFGLVRMCQLVLLGMRAKGWGRIVNVSSMGGEFTTPFAGFYHATKYAVESLSDALRMEVQPLGIDVVVIQPGGINTPLAEQTIHAIPDDHDSAYAPQLQAFRRTNQAMLPMLAQISVSPEKVAQAILDAVQADQPLTRYKVNTDDMTQVNLNRSASDRERDSQLRQQLGLTTPA